MELPIELKEKIEEEILNIDDTILKQSAINISRRYREETSNKAKNQLITCNEEALAYSASRMPATYGAIYKVISHCIEIIKSDGIDLEIKSLLDVGAGTGAGSWAVSEQINIEKITCIENESYMMNIGKKLMQAGSIQLKNSEWVKANLLTDEISGKYDLVISSYVINEIPEKNMEEVLGKLLNATNKLLVIIEPGTPEGYEEIRKIRQICIQKGENILAPCPHTKECKINKDDWCSFSCRVARTKMHKILKNGDAPYEDEKFSYIAISKFKSDNVSNIILRHPKIESGKITVKLCTADGRIVERVITRKEKELFKRVKKLNSGDFIN